VTNPEHGPNVGGSGDCTRTLAALPPAPPLQKFQKKYSIVPFSSNLFVNKCNNCEHFRENVRLTPEILQLEVAWTVAEICQYPFFHGSAGLAAKNLAIQS
jgi:hypothetical protein